MDIYREEILDHYKNPRNSGRLPDPSLTSHEANTMCGDVVDLDILVEDGVIKDIKLTGIGCAVSVAAGSMLSELVKGKSIEEASKISKEEMLAMVNLGSGSAREKCALLSYNALQKAIR